MRWSKNEVREVTEQGGASARNGTQTECEHREKRHAQSYIVTGPLWMWYQEWWRLCRKRLLQGAWDQVAAGKVFAAFTWLCEGSIYNDKKMNKSILSPAAFVHGGPH